MTKYQWYALLLLIIFYAAYLTKMFLQKRQGIRTNQMGRGKKEKDLKLVEVMVSIMTTLIVVVEAGSIYLGKQGFGKTACNIGLGFMLLGDIIFIMAMYTMSSNWRAGIPTEDQTELVTNGIYKVSRNPAFLGFDLVYLGVMLGFANYFLILITIITIVVLHMQILQEEKFLTKRFGKDYLNYKKQVGRYFLFI